MMYDFSMIIGSFFEFLHGFGRFSVADGVAAVDEMG